MGAGKALFRICTRRNHNWLINWLNIYNFLPIFSTFFQLNLWFVCNLRKSLATCAICARNCRLRAILTHFQRKFRANSAQIFHFFPAIFCRDCTDNVHFVRARAVCSLHIPHAATQSWHMLTQFLRISANCVTIIHEKFIVIVLMTCFLSQS